MFQIKPKVWRYKTKVEDFWAQEISKGDKVKESVLEPRTVLGAIMMTE